MQKRKIHSLLILVVIVAIAISFLAYLDISRVLNEDVAGDTPLYQRQLDDMQKQFLTGKAPQRDSSKPTELALIGPSEGLSACAGSFCVLSGCGGSLCGASGCMASGCAGSGCVGSGCVGSACLSSGCGGSGCLNSACGGSGCLNSNCVGSACINSNCVGSACRNCRAALDGGESPNTKNNSSCPLAGANDTLGSGRIVGFNVAPMRSGTVVMWITYGADVRTYRLYRSSNESGVPLTLVKEGKTRSGSLMRVVDSSNVTDAVYRVEVKDAVGRSIHVSSVNG